MGLNYSFGNVLEGLELYGENLFGIHSITYDQIAPAGDMCPFFRLFGVKRHDGVWLSWADIVGLAQGIGVQIVPVVLPPGSYSERAVHHAIISGASSCSALSRSASPEGFVVRVARAFRSDEFAKGTIAKYVRANHVQTGPTWRRTWRKAHLA